MILLKLNLLGLHELMYTTSLSPSPFSREVERYKKVLKTSSIDQNAASHPSFPSFSPAAGSVSTTVTLRYIKRRLSEEEDALQKSISVGEDTVR